MYGDMKAIAKLFTVVIAVFAAVVTIGLIHLLSGPEMQEILLDADSSWWPFTIQNFMWVAFFVGLGEVVLRWMSVEEERRQLKRGYLPDDDALLSPALLGQIRQNIHGRKQGKNCFLPRMLVRTIDQYQLNANEEQASSMLNASLDLYMHEIDLRYSTLRYITWLIPTLGFIGTVLGIMFALNYAGVAENAQRDDFLYEVTARLGVAFTTTLLALALSAVLVLFQSTLQAREEQGLNAAGQYCLDKLILKLGYTRRSLQS